MRLPEVVLGERQLKITRPFMSGTDVRHLQQALKDLGFYSDRIDGIYGINTDRAFRRFKKYLKEEDNEKAIETLKNYEKYGIGFWRTFHGDFSNTGYFPFKIRDQLNTVFLKNIKGINSMAVYKKLLFVSGDDFVICLDAKNDEVLWYNNEINPRFPITANSDYIIIPDEGIILLEPFSGRMVERIDLKNPVYGSAVYYLGKIFFAEGKGSIIGYKPGKGIVWEFNTDGAYSTPPALYGENLFFASYDRNVYCLDLKGEVIWKTKIYDYIIEPLFVFETFAFALGEEKLYAFDSFTGQVLWIKVLPERDFITNCLAGNILYIVTTAGNLFILNKQKGDFEGIITLKEKPNKLFFGNGEKLFIGSQNGLLVYAVSESGVFLKEEYLKGHNIKAVAFSGKTLFAATEKGLFALS
ncbi:MAG: PQQ-binding-like beta-propeller repeat protein [Thermovenabulum sp.]|uniref:outer membrane protein assembly factor BamB family protein n=1 Tax=Thermovenabulum sp. TaxID=3100335 RepID=UPI003C7B70EA